MATSEIGGLWGHVCQTLPAKATFETKKVLYMN
jgi:hypothetical protein